MPPIRALVLLALALPAAACATAPPPTEDEQALLDEMTERTIVPASTEAREAAAGGDLVSQMAFWTREYENNPADRDAALGYARISRLTGRPGRAAAIANQALALRPDDPALLAELGAALIMDGRAEAAVQPLELAVLTAPDDARLRNLLGAALDAAGEHALARVHYEAALDIRGEDAVTLTNYAMSWTLSGDAEQAEALLRRAVRLPGSGERARQNLALALALQGKFEEAERLAQQDLPREVAEANVAYIRDMTGLGAPLRSAARVSVQQQPAAMTAGLEPASAPARVEPRPAPAPARTRLESQPRTPEPPAGAATEAAAGVVAADSQPILLEARADAQPVF